MKKLKRLLSCLLCVAMIVTAFPVAASADTSGVSTINNGYIKVQVSNANGGFTVNTAEGDLIKKSDNNKKLLFHDDEYDTSFVSFRVEYAGGKTEDYIFGGKYGGLMDPSRRGVQVTQGQANGDIVAQWSVGELTFQQTITLANTESNEHGMVSVQLAVQNNGSEDINVKARLLLDTYLGSQDFGYYEVLGTGSVTNLITEEKVIDGTDFNVPQNFYAVDDTANPGIAAYSVSAPDKLPYQIAFGHWNNLAASLFDFTPGLIDFTKNQNDYMTADSAYALYYDMGSVAASGGSAGLVSYYGVYSRHNVSVDQSVAIDVTAPLRLELNTEKSAFERLSDVGEADFKVSVSYENLDVTGAKDYSNIKLAVESTSNLRSLSDNGAIVSGQDFDTYGPFVAASPTNFTVGQKLDKDLYFKAKLSNEAAYERITIGVYDVSGTGGTITEENRLGVKEIYVLIPGNDGNIPKVSFTSMNPDVIYSEGTRHLFVTVTNPAMLDNGANWNMVAYTADKKTRIDIPHSNMTVKDGVMDIVIDDTMKTAAGSWFLQLEWTPAAVDAGIVTEEARLQTSSQLKFTVSNDKKYKNDSYGILAVVKQKYKGSHPTEYRIETFKNELEYFEFTEHVSAQYSKEILLEFRGEFTKNEYIIGGESGTEKIGTYYTAASSKKLNESTREYEVENGISINGCMDFEGGTLAVYYEDYKKANLSDCLDSPVCVEFDGELLTSDARTSIWKGKAAFTKIEQGEEYSLRPYDENGVRKEENFQDNTIKLIWPSVYGAAQTLAGMIFNLTYAELGALYEEDNGKTTELGRVLSFTAKLDLSFTGKSDENAEPAEKDPTYWSKIKDIWAFYREDVSLYQYCYNGNRINKLFDFSDVKEGGDDEEDTGKSIKGSVMVQDVLFGCGEGFVGVHFKVNVGVANYISGLPNIQGELEVNTIHDWSFGFEGGMKLSSFEIEAKLKFKSHNDIPVPDEIYFYIGGFKPGLNIDGCGVVWITGGGGGIENIYDTIFLTDKLPPLKLIMSVSFSIVQILDGKATLGVGLTGIELEAKDLKILGYIEAIQRISLGLEWYPSLELKAAINVNLFQGVIEGGGYIVLIGKDYTDWFFEMFAYAKLKVPGSIPLVGGMEIAGVNLGMSTEKIWGGLKILAVELGVTYYWGESKANFFTGSNSKAQPTYPDLLKLEGVNENGDTPVYYDEENDRILYAHFGTNVSQAQFAEPIAADGSVLDTAAGAADKTDGLKLMDINSSGGQMSTATSYTMHRLNLGAYNADNSAAIVQIDYDATSLEDAKAKAKTFKINSVYDTASKTLGGTATEFPIVLYGGGEVQNGSGAAQNANANVTFDSATNRGSFSFTVTDPAHYGKNWYISTGSVKTNVAFYNVETMPNMTSVKAVQNGRNIDITYAGTKLSQLDKVSFYLTDSKDPSLAEPGYEIAAITPDGWISNSGSTYPLPANAMINDTGDTFSVEIPADLQSGNYYLRAVYTKSDELNEVIFSSDADKLSFTNPDAPAAVSGVSGFGPAGDLTIGLTVADPGDTSNIDGYAVTVYNADGTATDVANMVFERTSGQDTYINVGGSYTGLTGRENGSEEGGTAQTYGLTAGKSYKVGITPYKLIDSDGNGDPDKVLYGSEFMTGSLSLPERTTPNVQITPDKAGTEMSSKTSSVNESGEKDKIITFASDKLTLTAKATGGEKLTGTWSLDGASKTDADASGKLFSATGKYGEFSSAASITIPITELTDGRHTLTIRGKDAEGDSFMQTYGFAVDTQAPRFILKTPVNGSLFETDGSLEITGITDTDALFTVKINGTTVTSKKTISQISGASIDNEGIFSFKVNVPGGKNLTKADVSITAEDALGNKVSKSASVANGGVKDIKSVLVKADGQVVANGNIPGSTAGSQTKKLTLVGKTSDGTEFVLDSEHVIWECRTVDGTASVTSDGTLTIGSGAQGIVTGKYEVSGGAYMTYTLCFGAEIENNFVYTGSDNGGSVSGGGYYRQGEEVKLQASADLGYTFDGWQVVSGGVTLSSTTQAATAFTMPAGNVVVKAKYKNTGLPQESTPTASFEATGADSGRLTGVTAGMKYSTDGGITWKDITGTSADITGITAAKGIKVKKPGNGTTTSDSEAQTITVTKAAAPTSAKGIACSTSANNNGKITGVTAAMEYRTSGSSTWTDCSGDTITGLVPGTYQVRVKATGSSLASEPTNITVNEYTRGGGSGGSGIVAPIESDNIDAKAGELVIVDIATGKISTVNTSGSTGSAASAGSSSNEKLAVKSGDIPYYYDADGQRIFVAFSAEKDGKIMFIAPKDGKYYFTGNEVTFKDTKGYWAESQVGFTAAREIFNGIGDGNFGPKDSMTRAMFVTVLWRMAGKPAPAANDDVKSFSDVKASAWYAEAVAWGSANDIVKGMSEDVFAPNALVTREQMCALLSRFLEYEGIELQKNNEAVQFGDGDKIGKWAKADVEFCQTAGLINGYPDGTFRPSGEATRAENAAVFERMINMVIEQASSDKLKSAE